MKANSQSINKIVVVIIGALSLGASIYLHRSYIDHLNSSELGGIMGTFAVLFIFPALAYKYARGKLNGDPKEDKMRFIRGFVGASIILAIIFYANLA